MLHDTSNVVLSDVNEEWRLAVLIGIELQESRMLAGEQKLQEALDKIDVLLDKLRSGLLRAKFCGDLPDRSMRSCIPACGFRALRRST